MQYFFLQKFYDKFHDFYQKFIVFFQFHKLPQTIIGINRMKTFSPFILLKEQLGGKWSYIILFPLKIKNKLIFKFLHIWEYLLNGL